MWQELVSPAGTIGRAFQLALSGKGDSLSAVRSHVELLEDEDAVIDGARSLLTKGIRRDAIEGVARKQIRGLIGSATELLREWIVVNEEMGRTDDPHHSHRAALVGAIAESREILVGLDRSTPLLDVAIATFDAVLTDLDPCDIRLAITLVEAGEKALRAARGPDPERFVEGGSDRRQRGRKRDLGRARQSLDIVFKHSEWPPRIERKMGEQRDLAVECYVRVEGGVGGAAQLRFRDKIAASKKKGMWMGGPVPLGYDVRDRKLVVNEAEAETVRLIFKRHQAVGTIQALVADLTVRRIISKRRTLRDGRETGGEPYRAGALTHLLRNVLYTGQVSHHGTIYAGEHDAIVDRETWEASQALLDRSEPRPRTGHIAMLGGMIEDGHGRRMTSAHANKGGRHYLYYVSVPDTDQAEREWRLPAGDVDTLVRNAVLGLLRDPLRLAGEYGDVLAHARLAPACAGWVDRLQQPAAMRAALQQLDAQVIVGANRIDVGLSARELATLLHVDGLSTSHDQRIEGGEETSLKRRGHELRLVYAAPDANPPARDDRLIQLIASGHAAYEQLLAGEGKPGTAKRSHLVRLARLRFLAPDIVTAIVHGRQPVDLTSRALLRAAEMPLAWVDQRKVLGFASAHRN